MGMAMYRLCLLNAHGRIAAVQRFHADTDREALGVARETVRGVSGWVLAGFDDEWPDLSQSYFENPSSMASDPSTAAPT